MRGRFIQFWNNIILATNGSYAPNTAAVIGVIQVRNALAPSGSVTVATYETLICNSPTTMPLNSGGGSGGTGSSQISGTFYIEGQYAYKNNKDSLVLALGTRNTSSYYIIQRNFTGEKSQQWVFEPKSLNGATVYYIKNAYSNYYLAEYYKNNGTNNPAKDAYLVCNGKQEDSNHQWAITKNSDGSYRFYNRYTGGTFTNSGSAGGANNANMVPWTYNSSGNKILLPVSVGVGFYYKAETMDADGDYKILNLGSKMTYNETTDVDKYVLSLSSTKPTQEVFRDDGSEWWNIIFDPNTISYKLLNCLTDKVLADCKDGQILSCVYDNGLNRWNMHRTYSPQSPANYWFNFVSTVSYRKDSKGNKIYHTFNFAGNGGDKANLKPVDYDFKNPSDHSYGYYLFRTYMVTDFRSKIDDGRVSNTYLDGMSLKGCSGAVMFFPVNHTSNYTEWQYMGRHEAAMYIKSYEDTRLHQILDSGGGDVLAEVSGKITSTVIGEVPFAGSIALGMFNAFFDSRMTKNELLDEFGSSGGKGVIVFKSWLWSETARAWDGTYFAGYNHETNDVYIRYCNLHDHS